MLFPFSLKNKVRTWFKSLPSDSIVTWKEMTNKFLSKYFPPSKPAKFEVIHKLS